MDSPSGSGFATAAALPAGRRWSLFYALAAFVYFVGVAGSLGQTLPTALLPSPSSSSSPSGAEPAPPAMVVRAMRTSRSATTTTTTTTTAAAAATSAIERLPTTGVGGVPVGGVATAAAASTGSVAASAAANSAIAAAVAAAANSASAAHNTPPTFSSRRDWIVDEAHRIGERVFAVRTLDPDGDAIRFSLAPALFRDGSSYFRVDAVTGEVFLVRSLAGRGGQDLYMYVRADDGHHQAKMEVSIRVIRAKHRSAAERKHELDAAPSKPSISDIGPPLLLPPGQGRPYLHSGLGPLLPPPLLPPAPPPGHKTSSSGVFGDDDDDDGEAKNNIDSNGNAKTPSSSSENYTLLPVLLFTAVGATLATAALVAVHLFRRKWTGFGKEPGRALEKIKSKGSIFDSSGSALDNNDSADKEIALTRMPSPPSWVQALEKREPVLKPAEFFSTLTDDKWEFPRHHLRFLHILGEGCFGQVWKCEAVQSLNAGDSKRCPEGGGGSENGGANANGISHRHRSGSVSSVFVAVKTLKDNASEKEKRDLLSELAIMKLLDPHPNIVTLLGCCTEKDPLFVIMEYVRLGKLQTFLRDSRRPLVEKNERALPTMDRDSGDGSSSSFTSASLLTSIELTRFGYEVAKGMEYLSAKGIIHRDLAARNVLVTENRQCKVADFGFARDVISSHVYERKSEGRLPVRWMAPESLYDNLFTTKSDVWAFGVLLWEIVTLGSTPYPGMGAEKVMRRVRDGYRLEKPEHCKREMYNIMFYCWDANPAERPSFTELTHLLEKLIVSENDYIELERFPEHAYYNVCHDLPDEKL